MDATATRLLDLQSEHVRRTCLRLIVLFVLLGAAGRIKQYIARPSYWNDEAAVVINVMQRGYGQLLDRLDYAQAAPPAFLWIERWLYEHFGAGEYSLRAFPLAMSLLVLPLFARLAWRLLPCTSAMWAVGWLVLFQKILHQGPAVKQYSCDLCVAVILLLLTFDTSRWSPARRILLVSLTAAATLWVTFPTVFLYGAISLTLLPECRRAGRAATIAWLVGGLTTIASFLGMYRAALWHGGDPSLVEFWHLSFPDLQHPFQIPLWISREIYGLMAYPFDSLGALTAVLSLLGAVALWRLRQRRLLAIFAITLLLAFGAAVVRKYPFPGRHRLGLYLVPISVLILGAGAEGQNVRAPAGVCRWWWVLAVPLLFLELGQCIKDLAIREEESTTRQVVEFVRAHRKDDEPIYLFGDSLGPAPASGRSAEFLCYWPHPPGKVTIGYTAPADIRDQRFWLVYSLNRPETPNEHFAQDLLSLFPHPLHVIERCQPRQQSGAMLVSPEPSHEALRP